VTIEIWRGFIFVNVDGKAGPLAELTAPLDGLFDAHGVTTGPATLRRSHDLDCNWKTYVENYLEGYHISAVHPKLASEVKPSTYRVSMVESAAVHEVETLSGVNDGLWVWLWPNLAFNVYRYGLMVEHMRPLGHNRTRLDYLYFYDPATSDMEAVLETSDGLTLEDKVICEAVQRNLDAGVYTSGVLSPATRAPWPGSSPRSPESTGEPSVDSRQARRPRRNPADGGQYDRVGGLSPAGHPGGLWLHHHTVLGHSQLRRPGPGPGLWPAGGPAAHRGRGRGLCRSGPAPGAGPCELVRLLAELLGRDHSHSRGRRRLSGLFHPGPWAPGPALAAVLASIWLFTLANLVGPRLVARIGGATLLLGLAPSSWPWGSGSWPLTRPSSRPHGMSAASPTPPP